DYGNDLDDDSYPVVFIHCKCGVDNVGKANTKTTLNYMGRPTAQTRNTSQTPTNNVREAMQIRMNNGHVSWMNNGMIMDDEWAAAWLQKASRRRQYREYYCTFDGGGGGSFGDEAVVVDFAN
ncbi:hypothetical protein Tco_1307537, partial [Tanacetum coccineum]